MYVCLEPPEVPPLTNLKKLNWWSNTERFSWGIWHPPKQADFVGLRKTYMHAQEPQTYIHTYILAWGCHTYIHTYLEFARRINIGQLMQDPPFRNLKCDLRLEQVLVYVYSKLVGEYVWDSTSKNFLTRGRVLETNIAGSISKRVFIYLEKL